MNKTEKINELRSEIANCNQAIKAFKLGVKWLAPDDLSQAPSVKWLEMQKRLCVLQINDLKAA